MKNKIIDLFLKKGQLHNIYYEINLNQLLSILNKLTFKTNAKTSKKHYIKRTR